MKFELGKQVLLLVGTAYREVVITGRARYLRGADQYLVEDLDPDSQRGAFWVEEPGLQAKASAQATDPEAEKQADLNRLVQALWERHGLDYYDPKEFAPVRIKPGVGGPARRASSAADSEKATATGDVRYPPTSRVDFSKADRDWTPPATAVPTSRGFYIGDRVIHPHYGGGIVTANVNGHTEVRFYGEDMRTHFTGATADELKLASLSEASEAFPSEAALIEKAVRDAVADGACVGLGKAVDRILKEQRAAIAPTEGADAASVSLVGDRIFSELATGILDPIDGFAERVIGVFADRGYSMNLSFHKPDPSPEVASLAPSE